MTYRTDPSVEETDEHVIHERRTYDDRPYDRAAAGDQVNVNARGSTYAAQTSPLVYARRVVGLIFGILIALIGLRILLLALGANEGNGLVDAIYGITEPLVAPFRGIFSIDEVRPIGRSVLDVAAVVAIVGWSLLALVIVAILRLPERA